MYFFTLFYYIILQKLFACCHELQVNKADRTEVDVVTHCDELQVNKANKTEVEVVTHCDELQVNKADRTEVEVVTHCDELPPLQFYRPYSLVVHHSE